MGKWKEVDHTADLALHIWADSLLDLFATAARGMFSLIGVLDGAVGKTAHSIKLSALDVETLLVDWLNELLYLSEREGVGFSVFEFEFLQPTRLQAKVYSSQVVTYLSYVKAATFHNLVVQSTENGYETELVFDI